MSDRSRALGSQAAQGLLAPLDRDCRPLHTEKSSPAPGWTRALYNMLHRELLTTCRSLADSAGEESRAYYEGLEELARPWLNPKTLAQADREILDGLLARCRSVEAELGGRSWFSAALGLTSRGLLPVAVLAGSIFLLGASGVDFVAALDHARGWSDVIWIALRRTSDLQRLAIVTVSVLLASVYGVSRTARS